MSICKCNIYCWWSSYLLTGLQLWPRGQGSHTESACWHGQCSRYHSEGHLSSPNQMGARPRHSLQVSASVHVTIWGPASEMSLWYKCQQLNWVKFHRPAKSKLRWQIQDAQFKIQLKLFTPLARIGLNEFCPKTKEHLIKINVNLLVWESEAVRCLNPEAINDFIVICSDHVTTHSLVTWSQPDTHGYTDTGKILKLWTKNYTKNELISCLFVL